ncbi:MAG: hypothetical protein WC510_05540 [Candidatus Omnitrophota bacterium]
MEYQGRESFTVLEIIITVVIVAIISAVALPVYTGIKERSLAKEAKMNLRLIATAQKVYRMDWGAYFVFTGNETSAASINRDLKTSITEDNWDYAIVSDNSSFTIYADRTGSGGYKDCIYTLTHNDADGEPDPSGGVGTCP